MKNLFKAMLKTFFLIIFLNFHQRIFAMATITPGILPATGSTVALKSGTTYITYGAPEAVATDGSMAVMTGNGGASTDVSCQFKLTVVDATKGTFRLTTLDGRAVEGLGSVVGIDKNATTSSVGTLLYFDSNGHIASQIDPASTAIWYPAYGLSNAVVASSGNYAGWNATAYAYWVANASWGSLRNCINVGGQWVPMPGTSASTFTFEVIPSVVTTTPVVTTTTPVITTPAVTTTPVAVTTAAVTTTIPATTTPVATTTSVATTPAVTTPAATTPAVTVPTITPGTLPATGSTVALKSGTTYITYGAPEAVATDGSMAVMTGNGGASTDVSCQFKLTVVDATKGTFRLTTLDGRAVEGLGSVVGIDKNATTSSVGTLLYFDSNGHIASQIDPASTAVWYPAYGLSNAVVASSGNYAGWNATAYAYWVANASWGSLRNCINVGGQWVPMPATSASAFTFEVIPSAVTTTPVVTTTTPVITTPAVTTTPVAATSVATTPVVVTTAAVTTVPVTTTIPATTTPVATTTSVATTTPVVTTTSEVTTTTPVITTTPSVMAAATSVGTTTIPATTALVATTTPIVATTTPIAAPIITTTQAATIIVPVEVATTPVVVTTTPVVTTPVTIITTPVAATVPISEISTTTAAPAAIIAPVTTSTVPTAITADSSAVATQVVVQPAVTPAVAAPSAVVATVPKSAMPTPVVVPVQAPTITKSAVVITTTPVAAKSAAVSIPKPTIKVSKPVIKPVVKPVAVAIKPTRKPIAVVAKPKTPVAKPNVVVQTAVKKN